MLLVAYSIAHVSIREAAAALICGGATVGIYYIVRHWFNSTPELAVALSIGSMIFSVFFGVTMTGVTDGNPYDYVAPYLGAFSVWAITAVMWQEIRWFAQRHDLNERFPPAAAESAGFGVGLLYTTIYVLISVHGPNGSPNSLFFGFLVMWLMSRFLRLMYTESEQEAKTC